MLARPGLEERLEVATREFAAATLRLPGALGSSLYRSETDLRTLHLLERFESEESFAPHMASDYFARFQLRQQTLLAAPGGGGLPGTRLTGRQPSVDSSAPF